MLGINFLQEIHQLTVSEPISGGYFFCIGRQPVADVGLFIKITMTRIKDQQITAEITHSTMAACPPDSLEQVFIKDLNAAAIYFMREDTLYIDLKYDSGTMEFLP